MKRFWQKLLVLVGILAFAVSALTINVLTASAASYSSSSVFSTTNVNFDKETIGADDYLVAKLYDGSVLSYKKNMALKWHDAYGDDSYFEFVFKTPSTINFDKLTITMQATAYTATSTTTVATNKLVFEYDSASSALKAYVNDKTDGKINVTAGQITIALSDYTAGKYTVSVNGVSAGQFTNVGEMYAKYSSSSSNGIVPLEISAEGISSSSDLTDSITIISLNGQSFKVDDNLNITDDTAPVLVVNEEIKQLPLGSSDLGIDYVAIDVLSTVSTNVLQYVYTATGDGSVTIDDYTKFDKGYLSYDSIISGYDNAYISVAYSLKDTSDNEKDYYLDWYAASGFAVQVPARGTVPASNLRYIAVGIDEEGPSYNCINNDAGTATSTFVPSATVTAYQTAVTEAAEGLNVGVNSYFYLPSLFELVADGQTDYRNLKFTICYKTNTSSGSATSALNYDSLKLSVDDLGTYAFKVLVSDAGGNSMRVYVNGELTNVTKDNIWDIDCIPEFSFSITTPLGPTIADSDEQNLAYVGIEYAVESFEITAISGYNTQYSLYKFKGDVTAVDYDDLIDGSFFADLVAADASYTFEDYLEDYWTAIEEYQTPANSDEEDVEDEIYPFNKYNWRASSLSFTPQEEGYYMVYLEVVDPIPLTTNGYKVIESVAKVDENRGQINWFKNNYLSVIFISVGALSLVGIILLLSFKPRTEKYEAVASEKVHKGSKAARSYIEKSKSIAEKSDDENKD